MRMELSNDGEVCIAGLGDDRATDRLFSESGDQEVEAVNHSLSMDSLITEALYIQSHPYSL